MTATVRHTSCRTFITLDGQELCAEEWGRKMGWSRGLVMRRINAGWEPEEAILAPPHTVKRPRRTPRATTVIEELEWIIPGGATLESAAKQLGYTRVKSLKELLRRHKRNDLRDRLHGTPRR